MAESFLGGVQRPNDRRGEFRARVALVGSNVEALTGDETFRIPLTRCEVTSDGERIVVRDLEGTMSIWSDEGPFLDALERTRSQALTLQVQRVRAARQRHRIVKGCIKVLAAVIVFIVVGTASIRWALRGGIVAAMDRIGQSALSELALPVAELEPVDTYLTEVADQLKPAASLNGEKLRVLVAGYDDVYAFHLPPNAVVVTSRLVCNADDPNLIVAAAALELAHLEARDLNSQTQQLVDWNTSFDVLLGDSKKLRDYMLDYAGSKTTPGYTEEQEFAATERAIEILNKVLPPLEGGHDVAKLLQQVKEIPSDHEQVGPASPEISKNPAMLRWHNARQEACDIVGNKKPDGT